MSPRGRRFEIIQQRHVRVVHGDRRQLHGRRRRPRPRRDVRRLGGPVRRTPRRPAAGGLLPLRQPRGAGQAPRPDRRGPDPQGQGTRPRPGELLRRRQRHHPSRHRPRRGGRTLRAGAGRPEARRRRRHGDHGLRHPRRHAPAPSAGQDRDVQRARAGHRRPLRLPGARPVVAQVRPGPAGLGRRPAAPVRRGAHLAALRAAQVLGLDVPADPDQPWPPLPPRGTLEVRRDDIHWAREYLVPWIGRRLRGESSGDAVSAKRPDLLPL